MRFYRLIGVALAAAIMFTGRPLAGRSEQAPRRALRRIAVRRAALPPDRPGVDVRPDRRPRGLRSQSVALLRRHRARRRVEDHEQRDDVRGAVPGPGPDVDRRRDDLAVQPRSRLGRHRRVEQPPEHVVGRRRLQVDRRRQDLHQHGSARVAPHQSHRHRSAATTTSCSWPQPAACGGPAAIAASTRPPTAAAPGSRSSRSTTTPARTTW